MGAEGLPQAAFVIDSLRAERSVEGDVTVIAAVDALMQWRFAPPTRQGRPMIVRATQLFNFSEHSPK